MNTLRRGLVGALAIHLLLASTEALGQSASLERSDSTAYRLVPDVFSLDLMVSGVYDSNIDHNQEDLDAYGFLAGGRARLRSSPRRPLLSAEYKGALESYSRTDRWDRVTHKVKATAEKRLGPLTLGTIGEVKFKASTEDRELGNQYTVSPQLELELLGSTQLRLYGAYRLKRFEDTSRDETLRYAGGEFRLKTDNGSTWKVGYRYGENDSENPERRHFRWRYNAEYGAYLTEQDLLRLKIEYRPRRYPERLVDVEGTDVPREDQRWYPSASWTHRFPWGQEVRLHYKYQMRLSNDTDEEFHAHRVEFTSRFPLTSLYPKRARSTRLH